MAAKSDKGNSGKPAQKVTGVPPGKTNAKNKKPIDEEKEDEVEELEGIEEPVAKKSSKISDKKKDGDEEDDDDDVEVVDEWEKPEEEEEWDPDFEEFDLPKSKTKKAAGPTGKKVGKGEEDEAGIDEEFKDLDLFNDSGLDDEEEDY